MACSFVARVSLPPLRTPSQAPNIPAADTPLPLPLAIFTSSLRLDSMYAELWATWSAWWIRRFGTEGSKAKVYIAAIIPWLPIIVAIVPPAVLFTLAGRGFNNSFEQFLATREAMRRHEASWTPADGLDLSERASGQCREV